MGMEISPDLLQHHEGILVGFLGEEVQIKGYVELRTTFGTGDLTKTIPIRYIVVDAHSAYNVLLGRPTLNRLGAVVSSPHLKVKFHTDDGRVSTIDVDQEVARKCYENSLKGRPKVPPTAAPPKV